MSRDQILNAALTEFWEHGYGASGLNSILARCGLTKGGLYHHFGSKEDLAIAVLTQRIQVEIEQTWIAPISRTRDPIRELKKILKDLIAKPPETLLPNGSPLVALCNGAPARVIEAAGNVYQLWIHGLENSLKKAKTRGRVSRQLDATGLANYLVVTVEGSTQIMHATKSKDIYTSSLRAALEFLESLKK